MIGTEEGSDLEVTAEGEDCETMPYLVMMREWPEKEGLRRIRVQRPTLTPCLVWPFWPFHPIYWDGNEMEKMVLKMVWNSLKMVCKNDVRMV